jgi:hypothetical protein
MASTVLSFYCTSLFFLCFFWVSPTIFLYVFPAMVLSLVHIVAESSSCFQTFDRISVQWPIPTVGS